MFSLLTNCWSGKAPQELSPILRDILDPVNFPQQDTWACSVRYLQMVKELAKCPELLQTASAAVSRYHDDAIECLRGLAAVDPNLDEREALAGFERTWPKLSAMLMKESFFYWWLRDNAINSSFLHTYFTDLSATAMGILMAFGKSVDITGKYREIPDCDAAYRFVRSEPTFRSFSGREWFRQQLALRAAMAIGWRPELINSNEQPRRLRVLDLGAGLMPMVWNYELNPQIATQIFDFVAYDNNPDMPRNLQTVFGVKSMAELGIDYRSGDMFGALGEFSSAPLCGTVDMITIMGGVSYYTNRLTEILSAAEVVLRPGGMIIFDRQVFEESMMRCVKVLAWRGTSMLPDSSAQQAIDAVEKAAYGTGLIKVYHEVDTLNGDPAGVCFCYRKPE